MVNQLARNWWVVALRGIFAILFGVVAFLRPNTTLAVLVFFFGAYALLDGSFAVISALRNNTGVNHGWLLLEGIVGSVAGVLTFVWPSVTTLALVYLIASWAVITGIFEIMAAIDLRKTITTELLLILDGVLSVLFGGLIVFNPGMGAPSITWIIGLYAITFGIMLLGFSWRLRNWYGTKPDMPLTAGGHA